MPDRTVPILLTPSAKRARTAAAIRALTDAPGLTTLVVDADAPDRAKIVA